MANWLHASVTITTITQEWFNVEGYQKLQNPWVQFCGYSTDILSDVLSDIITDILHR